MTVELKPCPFCGGTNLKSGGDDKIVGTWCLTCEAAGPNQYGKYDWNRRADTIASLTARIAALEAAATVLLSEIDSATDMDCVIAASGSLRAALHPSPDDRAKVDIAEECARIASGLSCDEQFVLATRLAANVGYDLHEQPPHPDTPPPGAFEAAAEQAFSEGRDSVSAEDIARAARRALEDKGEER